MVICYNCETNNLETSRFCDECGTKLVRFQQDSGGSPLYAPPVSLNPASVAAVAEPPLQQSAQVRSVEIASLHGASEQGKQPSSNVAPGGLLSMKATLVIERGDGTSAEFRLTGADATIGRWDADNGVFPDVDLDMHDGEAKVSRRHARIKLLDGNYVIEDLGSTNGTYVNRGRRLLPGMPQAINDGDEVIVGKTFLRFFMS